MRKKINLLLFLSVSIQLSCFAQDSLSTGVQKKFAGNAYPAWIIKGKDICRYPSSNFTDAIKGLFPWVFLQNNDPNEFLFVLNGNLLSDVNSISLFDIEEVAFTRNNLDGNLFPFSRAGIFYITTKNIVPGKPVIRINTQYNMWRDKDQVLGFPQSYQEIERKTNNKTGFFQSNHISVALANDKISFYASVQEENIKSIPLYRLSIFNVQVPTQVEGRRNATQMNLKSFLNFTYKINEKLKVGISGNYVYERLKKDTNTIFGTNSTRLVQINNPLNYYHTAAFISWEPIKNLHNTISFEYVKPGFEYINEQKSNWTFNGNTYEEKILDSIFTNMKQYVIRNNLKYTFSLKRKINIETGLSFSRFMQKISYRATEFTVLNNQYVSYSGISYNGGHKFTTLTPRIILSYEDIVSIYAGCGFFVSKDFTRDISGKSKTNPFAGLYVNLQKLLKFGKALNRFDISFHYGDIAKNVTSSYWLDKTSQAESFRPEFQYQSTYSNYNINVFRNKLISVQMNVGLFNNRLLAGIEWSKLTSDRFISPFGTPYQPGQFNFPGAYFAGKAIKEGFSFSGMYNISDSRNYQWTIQGNLLFPTIKNTNDYITIEDFVYKVQTGLNNNITINNFQVQANCLLGIQRPIYRTGFFRPMVSGKADDFVLNYLLAGYEISIPDKSFIKGLNVLVQARNPIVSKKAKDFYRFDRYAGIGINCTF